MVERPAQLSRADCILSVFSKDVTFHSAYLLKTHKSTSSLNMLYNAESAQFYSEFLPTRISLTLRFRRNREV
jgi:hypothetical protein